MKTVGCSMVRNGMAGLLAAAALVSLFAACGTIDDGIFDVPDGDAATDDTTGGGDTSGTPDGDAPDGGTENDVSPGDDVTPGDDTVPGDDATPGSCAGDNPQGCASDAECAPNEACEVTDTCTPSSCFCDAESGAWVCTEDCGGGQCRVVESEACSTDADCAFGSLCEADVCVACEPIACAIECAPGFELVGRNGCQLCECEPVRECESSAECSDGGVCVGTGLCTDLCIAGDPACCEASYCEGGACEGPSPAGCRSTGCGDGELCVTEGEAAGCVSSSCSCDPGSGTWSCTDDCGGGTCVAVSGDCTVDTDCLVGAICEGGVCEAGLCPRIYMPVCGVDGVTYGNDCLARVAHVEVASVGECPVAPCNVDTDCREFEACVANVCQPDFGCIALWDPVCGTDGVTYGNECEATRAGVGVASRGECPPINCEVDEDCPPGEACSAGVCEAVFCPMIYLPVCGVDGVTYGNACMAGAARVEVAYEGECTDSVRCRTNTDCPRGLVCPIRGDGVCTEPCVLTCFVPDPVCGVDGNTYTCGEPEAWCNGVEVAYDGECSRP
ncbi:MAG: hypothetical protein KGO50_03425 [Myxococcales bacterium]|nr:hypothetical protein [Myxococcales bacterium]